MSIFMSLAIVAALNSTAIAGPSTKLRTGKPLKIFILAGQSNMQGKGRARTIERLNMTEDGKQMYKDMMGKDGNPAPGKDVYGVNFTAGRQGPVVLKGPLRPGYEGKIRPDSSFGPEYTFGIYMQKHLNEPILIIKTAWGGKNLYQSFRPPSAGELGPAVSKMSNPKWSTSKYYHDMVKHVNTVLADLGTYHPAYNKDDGYEITGFIWFQGYNDLVAGYPKVTASEKIPAHTDFSEYSRLMACFIRDVRKDFKTPKMPIVMGVMGIDGPIVDTKAKQYWFRNAQEAPAALPEFKGNVAAVRTEHYWDMVSKKIHDKLHDAATKQALIDQPNLKARRVGLRKAVDRLKKSMKTTVLTPEEINFIEVGESNASYHYMGSAYCYGKIGKAFADAMDKMVK